MIIVGLYKHFECNYIGEEDGWGRMVLRKGGWYLWKSNIMAEGSAAYTRYNQHE
jgi:hypothetical protein